MKHRHFYVTILMVLAFLAAGCSRVIPSGETKKSSSDYLIYYLNSDGLSLKTTPYQVQSESFDGRLQELLQVFEHPASAEDQTTVPDGVEINNCVVGVDSLTVDFSSSYLGMNNIEEILLRAALVRTLIQIPGVYRVSITVEGQTIREADGTAIQAMNADSFIESQGQGINSYQNASLVLYFVSADGNKLDTEVRDTYYSTNLTKEQVVVEQIIRGPQTAGLQTVTRSDVKVNTVTTENGVCHIDLSSEFSRTDDLQTDPELRIYAFVNAICENCEISGVQFSVEGATDIRYQDQVSLGQIFYPDDSLILQRETKKTTEET